jgi:hypothetical protein
MGPSTFSDTQQYINYNGKSHSLELLMTFASFLSSSVFLFPSVTIRFWGFVARFDESRLVLRGAITD